MARADDLTPLLAGAPPADVGFRQGVVTGWDAISKTNQIDVGGTLIADVPLLVTGGVTIKLGDVVGLLRVRSQYFLLGKILSPHSVDTVVVPGVYGLGLGAINQWPQTESTTEVTMIVASIVPHGTHMGWIAYTNVTSGATAQYRALVNGVEVGNSGVYQAGAGTFTGDADWPDDGNFSAQFELHAQVLSGPAGSRAAITLIQLYQE